MLEVDNTPALSPEKATRYKSAVGVLLYLASDLVECAFTIRGLAKFMSAPTERSWTMLKHLSLYLLAVPDNSLRLRICPNGLWHSPPNDDGMVLEMFQIQIGQLTKAIGVQSALVAFAFKVVF